MPCLKLLHEFWVNGQSVPKQHFLWSYYIHVCPAMSFQIFVIPNSFHLTPIPKGQENWPPEATTLFQKGKISWNWTECAEGVVAPSQHFLWSDYIHGCPSMFYLQILTLDIWSLATRIEFENETVRGSLPEMIINSVVKI